jgi:hypothetical protein
MGSVRGEVVLAGPTRGNETGLGGRRDGWDGGGDGGGYR